MKDERPPDPVGERADLLAVLERMGLRRGPGETPLEFAKRVQVDLTTLAAMAASVVRDETKWAAARRKTQRSEQC